MRLRLVSFHVGCSCSGRLWIRRGSSAVLLRNGISRQGQRSVQKLRCVRIVRKLLLRGRSVGWRLCPVTTEHSSGSCGRDAIVLCSASSAKECTLASSGVGVVAVVLQWGSRLEHTHVLLSIGLTNRSTLRAYCTDLLGRRFHRRRHE